MSIYEPLEQGEHPFYGLKWKVVQDLDVDLEHFKDFDIIATKGTGKYVQPDTICDSMDEFQAELDSGKYAHSQPLYMLAHGQVRLSLGKFGDPWDSGQCGFAAIKKEDADNLGLKPEEYESFLNSAVRTYDSAANGNVVGYVIWREKVCPTCEHKEEEVLDSCWGFVLDWGWGSMDAFVKENIEQQLNYFTDKFGEAEHAAKAGVKSDD